MKNILSFFFLFVSLFSFGQNLILNGDFEQYSHCPGQLRQISLAPNWFYPSEVIPDYFNGCTTSLFTGVPINNYGKQYAYSGSAYCGIVCYSQTVPDTRGYVEGTLNSFLVKDSLYHFEMRVNLSDRCKWASDDLGVYFSDTAVTGKPYYYPMPFVPQISNPQGNSFDTAQWTLVQGDYTAKGGEKYFIIGNFKDDASSIINLYNKNGGNVNEYLYIDDVILTGNALPKPKLQASKTTICAGSCINFSNFSENSFSYKWIFDGASQTTSTAANPSGICYNTPGKYDVRLIAINGSLRDTQLLDNYITVDTLPKPGKIFCPIDSICSGATVFLADTGSSKNIQWQSSLNNLYFTNISGEVNDSIIKVLSYTTYFRVVAANSNCSDTSESFKIIVKPSPRAVYTYKVTGLRIAFNSIQSTGDVISYKWNFGDDSTSIISSPVHTFSKADTFHVCLTVHNGLSCSHTLCEDIETEASEGFFTPANESSWTVYPNPAHETITVTPGSKHQQATVKIYNLFSQLLYSNEITAAQVIAVHNLTDALYFLTLESASGTEVKKIMVVH